LRSSPASTIKSRTEQRAQEPLRDAGGRPPTRKPAFALGAGKRFIIALICLGAIYLFKDKVSEVLDTIFGETAAAGPDFKVVYGYYMIEALDCPGGRCEGPES